MLHRISCQIPRLPAHFWVALTLSVLALIVLSARPDLTAQAAPTGNACGQITTNTTWISTNNPYTVTCDVQVISGVTLTIQPGVTVVFSPTTSLQVDGTLIARNVTFTSGKATPAKGDWGHIFFTATSVDAVLDANGNYVSGSLIQDSLIEWGGGGAGVSGALETASASPFIRRNTIRNNANSGIHAAGRLANQPVTIRENSISNNSTSGDGGGINVSAGRIMSNTVQNNSASGNGGGIYASASTITGNVVSTNSGHYGGGVYESGCTLVGNTASGNTGGGGLGGGIYAAGGTLTSNIVAGNYVQNFWVSYGGGVYITGGSMISNTISGNTADGYNSDGRGGGIYASLSTVRGNEIVGNTARHGGNGDASGGGIYASGGTVTNNTITGNAATTTNANRVGYGGGVYASGGTVSNNIINTNTASGGLDSQGGGVYGNVAAVQQNTLIGNSANKGGAIYSYQGAATANTVLTNTTALSGTVYIQQGTATQNTLQGNIAAYGGGLYGHQANLIGNILQKNTANLAGGGIYATYTTTVNGNTVLSNTALSEGGGIYANGGAVSGNRISFNSTPSFGQGSGLYIIGNPSVSYNHVLSNTAPGGSAGGIALNGRPQFQFNNLYGNLPYDAEVITSVMVTGTLNYWGKSPCTSIPMQIYDGNDLPGRGQLLYAPSLYSPLPLAQMASPASLSIITGTSSVTLTWTPIPAIPNVGCRNPGPTNPDWGYRIYYDTDSCPPYQGGGLPQGNSPIDAGQNTAFIVNGLPAGEYHFVVAAYDYLGRVSTYSNEVVRPGNQRKVYLPVILRNI